MSTTNKTIKKDSLLMYIAIAFIAGFLAGAAFSVYKMGPSQNPAVSGQPQGGPSTEQQEQMSAQQTEAITHLEAEVTANPDKFSSWTQLGNLYYDTGQYQSAIKAYEKSLELHSGDGNIWTDLGVMYRRTKNPQKAIESFNKAIEIEPTHETSRFNKGIVLLYDLNDSDGAIAAWEELLRINPEAKAANGTHIHNIVDQIKADLAKQGK
jgi:tetratricopeptide (TPR) repeat protein